MGKQISNNLPVLAIAIMLFFIVADAGGQECISGNCKDGYGTMTWSFNGNKYTGSFMERRFSGKGTMIYSTGDKYEGEWWNGKKNGQGIFTLASGETESGKWEGNTFLSKPINAYMTKSAYFSKNYSDKYYTMSDGCKVKYDVFFMLKVTWSGECLNGYANGYGRCDYYHNDDYVWFSYVGNMKDGKREGQGKQIRNNREEYVGEWKNDDMNGYGTKTLFDGEIRSGEVINGKLQVERDAEKKITEEIREANRKREIEVAEKERKEKIQAETERQNKILEAEKYERERPERERREKVAREQAAKERAQAEEAKRKAEELRSPKYWRTGQRVRYCQDESTNYWFPVFNRTTTRCLTVVINEFSSDRGRFYGTVIKMSWNSFNWEGKTLTVGSDSHFNTSDFTLE